MSTVHPPLRLRPILVPRVWGGDRIVREVHDELADDAGPDPIGESWEISDVGDDPALHSVVEGGPYDGRTLRSLIESDPAGFLGTALHRQSVHDPGEPARLPLLFKILDSSQPLSVQVHPPEAWVRAHETHHAPKTEAWLILDAAEGAWIVHGLDGIDYPTYLDRAEAGQGGEGLRRIEVSRGDLVYLPSGTVHAMGPGLLLAEIQQTSDSTFRLYDWDRVGLDGAPRTLHLDEARPIEPPPLEPCPYPAQGERDGWQIRLADPAAPFAILETRRSEPTPLPVSPERFGILSILSGLATVGGQELPAGSALFVPASCDPTDLQPHGEEPLWAMWMEPVASS
ncbi:MAG: type I phosphomannose isomerase catalytic subunit [Planctomycetota bacterium]